MEIIEKLPQKKLAESMNYTYLNKGKCVRSKLCVYMTMALGGNVKAAEMVGNAIESIHAFSLIHDDLPCMDNDDMRRGKKSNHIVYGEAMATLAGDALQSYAFSILSDKEFIDLVGETRAIKLVRCLSNASGYLGICGGQCLDIEADNKKLTLEELDYLVSLKTGALFKAAIECACIIACTNKETTKNALEFASLIGKAFQVNDDILDAGEEKTNTYVTLLGLDGAKKMAKKLYDDALEILYYTCPAGTELIKLIKTISERTY